jgi:hypothetical protein
MSDLHLEQLDTTFIAQKVKPPKDSLAGCVRMAIPFRFTTALTNMLRLFKDMKYSEASIIINEKHYLYTNPLSAQRAHTLRRYFKGYLWKKVQVWLLILAFLIGSH